MFKMSVDLRTCLKSLAECFHGIFNGFLRQDRPNQPQFVFKLGICVFGISCSGPAFPPKRDNPATEVV